MIAFRALALAGSVVAFLVALLGSWVRINGAGLTCPDWPLCRGAVVPALQGGVMLEWSHRAGVGLLTILVAATVAGGLALRPSRAALRAPLAALAAVLILQIGLGGATVLLGNSPLSVTLHWAAAMLLLGAFATLALLAFAAEPALRFRAFREPLAFTLTAAAALALVTMSAGAFVGSSYAGLACSTFPACDGSLLGSGAAQRLQMFHRFAAAALTLFTLMSLAIAWTRPAPRVRALTSAAAGFVLLQIILGAANVAFALPPVVREAHAANAALLFLSLVLAALSAALEGSPAHAGARLPRAAASEAGARP